MSVVNNSEPKSNEKANLVWKSQPIFISSTFTDMMAERDILRDLVLPELAERLSERKIRLEPIELRWGVETDEQAEKEKRELQILKVCLDEIDRCRPFFIGIIGDRYGWIPPQERMQEAENEKGFKSCLNNKSISALEMEYGVTVDNNQINRSLFFFRDPLNYDDMPEEIKANYSDLYNKELNTEEVQKQLDNLKKFIIAKAGKERVFTYKAAWNGEKITVFDNFKQLVTEQLWKQLEEHTKKITHLHPLTWEEEEQKYLLDFIDEKIEKFCGRVETVKRLKKFALSKSKNDNWGICITGESGLGKSALFSKLYTELQSENSLVLVHAAGISLRSNNIINMLTIWIKELAKDQNINIDEQLQTKTKYEEITKLFSELLSYTASKKRVVILVDALNQFEKTTQAKYVNWLPDSLPADCKIIFTAVAGEETENLLKKDGIKKEELRPINYKEANEIINTICKKYSKKMNEKVIEKLLEKKKEDGSFAYNNPLWLTMTVDEFLLLDANAFLSIKGKKGDPELILRQLLLESADKLPSDITGMYKSLFNKCKIFGEEFANTVLSYIGISRNGLRESDLELLINNYTNTKWDNLNFASLRRYLRTHLVKKGELGLWDFRHIQVRESLNKSLLQDEKTVKELHNNLAEHLESLTNEDPLHLTEILWHLFKSDNKKKTAEIYGSNWPDSSKTDNYSTTIKDILIEQEVNRDWFCFMLAVEEVSDNKKSTIIKNILFNLNDKIKHVISSKLLFNIFQVTINISKQLVNKNPESAEYARDLGVLYIFIGDNYKTLGDIKSTLQSYEKSLNISEDLQKRNPESAEYARDLSASYYNIGDMYKLLGDTSKALQHYKDAWKIADELHERYSGTVNFISLLSLTYNKVGDVYKAQGDTKRALQLYESSLHLVDGLVKVNSESSVDKKALLVSFNKIGDIYYIHGNTVKAQENYEKSLNISASLHKATPESAEYLRDLSISYTKLGEIYKIQGEVEKSLQSYENASKKLEALSKLDPYSVEYLSDLSLTHGSIGYLYMMQSDTKSALQSHEKQKIIVEDLVKRCPESAQYKNNLAVLYYNIGNIYLILDDAKSALLNYSKSLFIADNLVKYDPLSVNYAKVLSSTYNKIGDAYKTLGNLNQAIRNFTKSLQIDEKLAKLNPESTSSNRALSVSLFKVGEIYRILGDMINAQKSYDKSLIITKELRNKNPEAVVYARDLVVCYQKLQNNEELIKALLYMKERNMFMDPPIVELCKQLGIK